MLLRKTLLELFPLEHRTVPAVFTVTNLGESGPGSIRQAVIDANNNPGQDTVDIPANQLGSVFLTSGPITISDPIIITSPGTPVTALFGITTNYDGRVFIINAPTTLVGIACSQSTATGAFSGLGGAIYSTASLTLNNCGFGGDSATKGGAIYQIGSSLTLNRCNFDANFATQGASIWSTGTVSLQSCQFNSNRTNNFGSGGGGVWLDSGSLTIDSCSFRGCGSNNSTLGKGGAIYCNGTFFAKNCSFAQNGAHDGGALYLTSGGTLWNCTVAYNLAQGGGTGGGINGSVTLESTIVSDNSAGTGPDIFGAVTAKYCALGKSSGFSSYTNQGNNLPFGSVLQEYADSVGHGGLVAVVTIQATSPCKNAGSNPGGLLYDSRGPGFPRAVGTAPDIGAFEVQPPPTITVQVNDGSVQRSNVVQLMITFDSPDVLFQNGDLWQITRASDNANVTWAIGGPYPGGPTSWWFHFTGGPLNGNSLADGAYILRVFSENYKDGAGQNLDGNGDGVGGDDYVSATTPGNPNRIFRLFGDANGDATVDAADFIQFRLSLGGYTMMFDFDNDGSVSTADFIQFRLRFGGSI